MPMAPSNCSRCGASLEPGFIRDKTDRGVGRARWVEGEPEKSFLGGYKLRGKTQHDVQAFRCSSCGHLELYANDATG